MAVVLLVAAGLYGTVPGWRPAGNPIPFAPLDDTLAAETGAGWVVTVRPKREGPYRQVAGGGTVSANGVLLRVRDRDGTTEEVRLDPVPNEVQKVLELETHDGHRTLVALKRSR